VLFDLQGTPSGRFNQRQLRSLNQRLFSRSSGRHDLNYAVE
jgi:hypothetical protein